jgi:hypothetical protein
MKKVLGFALFLAIASAGPAFGASTQCNINSHLPALIVGNLDVPANQTCNLYGQEVTGNVTVEGRLNSFSARFDGNVTVTGGVIQIANGNGMSSAILGNLTITGSTGNSGIYNPNIANYILGNLTFSGNSGNLYIQSVNVGGTVSINNNVRVNNDYSGPYTADINNIVANKPISCSGNVGANGGSGVQGGNLKAPQVNGDCAPLAQ